MGGYKLITVVSSSFYVVIGVLLTAAYVTTFLITFPFLLAWRVLVSGVVKWRFPGCGRVLTPRDLINFEQFDGGVPQCSLVVVLELDGPVIVSELVDLIKNHVVSVYPELGMYVHGWFGVKVFVKEDCFRVEDHVLDFGVETGDLSFVHTNMQGRGYKEGTSPWEVIVFNSGRVVGIRVHHVLADGLSVLKLCVEKLGGKAVKSAKKRKNGRYARLGRVWNVVVGVGWDYVAWVRSFCGSNTMFWVRDVCKVLGGACGSSIVIAGIIGGLSKFLNEEVGVEKREIRFGYVLPVSGHPDALCNHWRTTYTTFSVDECSKPVSVQGLQYFDKMFLGIKNSSTAVFFKYSILYAGSWAYPFARFFLRNRIVGVGMTNMAGDDEGFNVCGNRCVGYTLSCRGFHSIGLMFSVITYKQAFRVVVAADQTVFSKHEVMLLCGFIDAEFAEVFRTCRVGRVDL